MQVWLRDTDRARLERATHMAGCSKSEFIRDALRRVLDELEERERAVSPKGNLFRLSKPARDLIERAKQEAQANGVRTVGGEHLFLALFADKKAIPYLMLMKACVDERFVRAKILETSGLFYGYYTNELAFHPGFNKALDRARAIATKLSDRLVFPEHILLALITYDETGLIYDVLELIGLDRELLRSRVIGERMKQLTDRRKKSKA